MGRSPVSLLSRDESPGIGAAARTPRSEWLLALGVLVVVTADIHFIWPYSLVGLDEGAFLYEARRVLDADVMYRDFFDLVGPLSVYVTALSFAVFGVSMETARGGLALLHGAIGFMLYWVCRRLGVRPLLAAAFGVAQAAIFYPALQFASPHWFSTLLALIVFWFVLGRGLDRPGRALAAGALTALVGLSQQPKGAATAFGVAIVIARDVWLARGGGLFATALIRQLAAYGGGVLAVLVPVLGGFLLVAGFQRVFEALIYTPLISYREYEFVQQGRWMLRAADWSILKTLALSVSPILYLNLMPFIIPVAALRLLWQRARGVDAAGRRPLFVAVVFSAFAMVSVSYQPNHFHFAIVGPIWLSLFAELTEAAVRRLERGWHFRAAAPVAAAAIMALFVIETTREARVVWKKIGVPSQTQFGLIHFHTRPLADEVESVRTVMQAEGVHDVLVYPTHAAMYLLTKTRNPTRFQLLIPGYNSQAQFDEVLADLERQQVPYILRTFWWWDSGDPLMPYIKEHYEGVRIPRKHKGMPSMQLFRRKTRAAAPPG